MRIQTAHPWDATFLVNQLVIEQHADELECDWRRRDRATQAPHYTLKDLLRVDGVAQAHLDALHIANDAGWKAMEALGFDEDGLVFSAAVLALWAKNEDWLQVVVDAACGSEELERGLISALGWLPFETVAHRLRQFLAAQSPILQRIGIAGFAVHRQDPGIALQVAARSDNEPLKARAFKACAELGRRDLGAELVAGVRSESESTRFWAAWSLCRLKHHNGVVLDSLGDVALAQGRYADRAMAMRVRLSDPHAAKEWCRQLRKSPEHHRLGVLGMGILGDPELIPEIIASTQVVSAARVAGAAFADITGIDLDYEDLDGTDPRSEDEQDENDLPWQDDDHIWPLTEEAFTWWSKNKERFVVGKRYLMGKPIDTRSLDQVLRNGTQRQRHMAAVELGIRSPLSVLFPVCARASHQHKLLATWTS